MNSRHWWKAPKEPPLKPSGPQDHQAEPQESPSDADLTQQGTEPERFEHLDPLSESGSPSLEEILAQLDVAGSAAPKNSRAAFDPGSSSSPAAVVDQSDRSEPSRTVLGTDGSSEHATPEPARVPPPLGGLHEILPDRRFPLALDHTDAAAAESFGILRSRLLRVQGKRGIRAVVITSPGVKEGKTLSAVNLGLSFGQLAQQRVLLVDGDLRARGTTRLLKMDKLPGLGDFLTGEKPLEAVVQGTSFPGLSVVPAGEVPEKALPELLEGSRWPNFIDYVKQCFDLVIVDSVPVGAPVADLELLLAPCDAFLLVVRMRRTAREGLARVPARLDRRKLLGVLVNAVEQNSDYQGYYYYRDRR